MTSPYDDPRDPRDQSYVDPRDQPTQVRDDRPRVVEDDLPADRTTAAAVVPGAPEPVVAGRHTVATDAVPALAREHAVHGGIHWGSAFLGWLTAMGLAAVLSALLVAAGTVLGVQTGTTVDEAVGTATANADQATTIGVVGAVGVLVVMFLAYLVGGYVAGRMARFDGARQGLAVWIWAVVVAALMAVAALVWGSSYDVLSTLNTFPRIPIDAGTVTSAGIAALVLAAVVSLLGAVLGGTLGMRYHRRVDATGLEATTVRA